MNPVLQKQLDAAGRAMAKNGEADEAAAGVQAGPKGGAGTDAGGQGEADARARSSPGNGKKGGRPEVDYQAVADAFSAWLGACPRHWRGEWWLYGRERAYRTQTKDEMDGLFSRFMDEATSPMKYTLNLQRNVFGALKKNFVDGDREMPLWLDSGAPAKGWASMRNGLLDLYAAARGEIVLRPHCPEFFGAYSFPFEYVPDAPAPLFDAYLDSVQNDDESRKILLKLLGLLLVPDTSFQVFFILYGEAGCGKSVFIKIAQAMLGRKNCCSIPLAMFAEKFATVDLSRCLANLVDDSPTVDGKTSLAAVEGILKEVSSGGDVWCEIKGVQGRSYPAIARCVFCQNPPLPGFADRSSGIWRRMRIIPFPNRFDDSERKNPRLADEIIAGELPGVFARAVRGLGMLLTENADGTFPETTEGARLVREHKEACDKEAAFLGEYCAEDAGAFVETQRLYNAYSTWCGERGFGKKNAANFAADVRRVFPSVQMNRVRRGGKRAMEWGGLSFLDASGEDEF